MWPAVQWGLFAIVLAAVGYRGWQLWSDVGSQGVQLHYCWLAAAVLLYTAAWTPAWIYWRRLLAAVGDQIPPLQTARAYYCGHLGKYIPGKAGVIVIRAAMIATAGGKMVRGGLTAGYESLTTLGTGAAVAAMLSPWVFPRIAEQPGWTWLKTLPAYPYCVPLIVAVLCLAALPLTAKIFAKLSGKIGGGAAELEAAGDGKGISTKMLFEGSLLLVAGWCVHGLALGCIILGSGAENVTIADWPVWTAAIAAAISGGFVAVFAPAGLGVREWISADALRQHITPQQAIVVAVLLRLVSLIGESAAAAGLWRFVPSKAKETT